MSPRRDVAALAALLLGSAVGVARAADARPAAVDAVTGADGGYPSTPPTSGVARQPPAAKPAAPSKDDDSIIIIDTGSDETQSSGAPAAAAGKSTTKTTAPAAPAATHSVFPWGGQTRFDAQFDSRLMIDTSFDPIPEDVVEWWNLGRLTLNHRPTPSLRVFADAWVRWGVVGQHPRPEHPFLVVNPKNTKWTGEVELREGYLTYHHGGFEVSAGQRIYVWGKNELLPPADVINPHDLRYDPLAWMTSTKDGKVPVFAIDAAYWYHRTGLKLVVVPFFTPNRVFLFGRDFSIAPPGSSLAQQIRSVGSVDPSIEDQIQQAVAGTRVPEESPNNASVALRAMSNIGGWDVAATAYYGWDLTPKLHVDADLLRLLENSQALQANPQLVATDPALRNAAAGVEQKLAVGQSLVQATYQRMWQLALEAEGVVGDFVVRADGGFSPGQVYYTRRYTPITKPTVRAVLGGEYTYGEEWYVALTAYTTMVLEAPQHALLFAYDAEGADPSQRQVAAIYGVSTTVRWLWEAQNIQVSATGLYNIHPGDYVANIEVAYKNWAPHEIRLGAVTVGGVNGGLGQLYEHNDFAYIEYRGSW